MVRGDFPFSFSVFLITIYVILVVSMFLKIAGVPSFYKKLPQVIMSLYDKGPLARNSFTRRTRMR